MHRRQLLLIHAVLSIAAALLAFRLVGEWRRANLRYAALARQTGEAPAYLPPKRPERPVPLLEEIIEKNLFTPDRNNEMAQAETAPPTPSLPVVFGTMNLGDAYEALMAEREEAATRQFRRVKTGERLGAYTVVEIQDEKVVIELQGQKTTLEVYQSANSVPRPKTRNAQAVSPVVDTGGSAPPQPAVSRQPNSAQRPASSRASAPQSPGPEVRVTIEGDRKRFERQTPFGPQVWYEKIEK